MATVLRLHDPAAYKTCEELDPIERLLPLTGARVLDLGCGKAELTRAIAERFAVSEIIATEVDPIQHARNLERTALPRIKFRRGGAEAINEADASVDIVLLFKSLHHVPEALLDQALGEIARVLRPGGLAYIAEPVAVGEFNAILELFHDEREVRKAALAALQRAVDSGLLASVEQFFYLVDTVYPDFADFAERTINVTYLNKQLDDAVYQQVKARFMAHLTATGARFSKPMRVDLLRKP